MEQKGRVGNKNYPCIIALCLVHENDVTRKKTIEEKYNNGTIIIMQKIRPKIKKKL